MPNTVRLTVSVEGTTSDFDGSRAVTIGRSATADVRIDLPFIAEEHAILELTDGRWHYHPVGDSAAFRAGSPVADLDLTGRTSLTLGKANGVIVDIDAALAQSAVGTPAMLPGAKPASSAPPQIGPLSLSLIGAGGSLGAATFPVTASVLLGRDPASDIVLTDPKASRSHARVMLVGDRPTVEDLGSTHGTRLNGRPLIGAAVLADGDRIEIASHAFTAAVWRGAAVPSPGSAGGTGVATAPTHGRPPVDPPPSTPGPVASPPPGQLAGPGGPINPQQVSLSSYERMKHELAVIRGSAWKTVALSLVVTIAVAGLAAGAWFAFVRQPSAADVIAGMHGQVVRVIAAESGSGTGWVYDADEGLIVTNHHVVSGATTHVIEFAPDDRREATLVATALCDDLAMLQVDDRSGLRTLPIGDQRALRHGDQVIAIGFPGTPLTPEGNLVTNAGVISVPRTTGDTPGNWPNLVQHDAAINGGNSGGPLVTYDGRLVGVNTFVALSRESQAYSIGAEHVLAVTSVLATGRSMDFTGLWVQEWSSILGDDYDAVIEALEDADIPWHLGLPALGTYPGTSAADAAFGESLWFVSAIDGQALGMVEGDSLVRHAFDGYCDIIGGRTDGSVTLTVAPLTVANRTFTLGASKTVPLTLD